MENRSPNFIYEIAKLYKEIHGFGKNAVDLFFIEAALAKKSLVRIVIIAFILIMLVFSTWISLMTLLIFVLHSVGLSWLISILFVSFINLMAIFVCYKLILEYIQYLKFPEIRKQLNLLR